MFEGKNIHYSDADQKPLCSFSGKVCNQRRLNNYGFCVRHILEDPSAPFKRCAHVAKSSRQICTQPIPKDEDRQYCNNHMQVLGMLPKKERKPKKEKERMGTISAQLHFGGAKSDPGLLQNKIKPRSTSGSIKAKMTPNKLSSGGEEMDDVYAFPADSNDNKIKGLTAVYSSVTLPSVSISVSGINSHGGATLPKAQIDTGQSSLAKIYPELAEKLEKIKPKVETKIKGKGKSSRTMNSLQTKIAQNKIKDKLKRNQCSSNTSSQSQSPSHSFSSSPGYQINSSSPNYSAQLNNSPSHTVPPNVTVMRDGIGNAVVSVPSVTTSVSTMNSSTAPSLSQLNLLNGLNLQTLNLSLEQLGLPVPTVSDIEQTLKQLASAANIPLEGTPMFGGESNQQSSMTKGNTVLSSTDLQMFPQTFPQQSRPPPPYSSVHHKPVSDSLNSITTPPMTNLVTSQTDNSVNTKSQSEVVVGHQIRPVTTSLSSASPKLNPVPQVTRQFVASTPPSDAKHVPTSMTALTSPSLNSLSPSSSSSSSVTLAASLSTPLLPMSFPGHPKLTLLTTSQTAKSVSSKVQEPVKQTSPVAVNHTKLKPSKSRPRSRNPSSAVKRPVPLFSLPMTVVKPRKIRKILDEEEVKKLKTKSAIDYYNKYKQKMIDHHFMVYSSIASSDESDLSDCDMLPWQPDWFQESSDEESMEDDEEIEYGLRTAKLALGRARLRRQCSQARRSNSTCHTAKSISDSTNCLIKAVRESSRSAVKCLQEMTVSKSKPSERLKSKGLVKRQCLYKDNEDVQCKGNVVPYTNHCIKHVMYNVDQQLFEYCTAKFADNTQCCHPVIDMKHELPLCMEHGVKADNFLKTQDAEPKPKRPRKKTKPSALTRPPKKGKKKKNQRKNVRPQKPLPLESDEHGTLESDNEEMSSQPHSEMNIDSDSDKGESQSSATDVPDNEKQPVPISSPAHKQSSAINEEASMVVKDSIKQGASKLKDEKKTGSVSQLEELENLTSLSELENVKMFGDLETASKLLEENDFQEVFNRIPDEAFDIFNNKASGLPSSEDLQDFEDSLALANRELKLSKEPLSTSSSIPASSGTPTVVPAAPILDESDELTRQIAEEIMKQNIGPSVNSGESICNGDAEESIKAIARSLSNTGLMLAAEAKNKSHSQEGLTNQGLSRTQSLPTYNNLDNLYYPPNVAIQNVPVSLNQTVRGLAPTAVLPKGQTPASQTQVAYGKVQTNIVPQNVTVTPQGIITTHLGSARLVPNTQTVTIGNTTVTGNQTAGIITVPVPQQLTAQQLSALVQQATAHLPPLPPYTPRSQTHVSTSASTQSTSLSGSRPVNQDQLVQQLTRQPEQIGEQPLLTQQLLQQRLAVLTQQVPIKVTLPSSQNLGFSTILHQGNIAQLGRLNQGVVHSIPNVGQISQLIKTSLPTSQSLCAPVSIPTTNIVWTSPPNVTITSPNGLPRTVAQSLVSNSKMSVANPKNKLSTMKETFIDLTDSNDPPPPYDVAKSTQNKSQPASYPAKTSTNTAVPGKS